MKKEHPQNRFFQTGTTMSVKGRLDGLRQLLAVIEQEEDDILKAIQIDLGKPELEAFLSEIYFVKLEIRLFCKNLAKWARPSRKSSPIFYQPAKSIVERHPYGRCLIAAPWNYPFQLAISPLIAAIAGGNVVTLLLSEKAPATAAIVTKILAQVFPQPYVICEMASPEKAQHLLTQAFDHFFFTGSTKVGRHYAEAAARQLAPCVLELGGKSPAILDSSADLTVSAQRIAYGKWFNAGQTCMAPDYVLVPETIHDSFFTALQSAFRGFGEPCSELTAIASDADYDRLLSLCESKETWQLAEDASVERVLSPRILPNTSWDAPAMQEEVFGPIVPLVPYTSTETMIKNVQSRTPDPLALYLFSRDREWTTNVSQSIRSGSVGINDVIKQATNLNLPFGGIGTSGMGRYRGKTGFHTFTWQKSITARPFSPDPFASHPPYKDKVKWMRRFL